MEIQNRKVNTNEIDLLMSKLHNCHSTIDTFYIALIKTAYPEFERHLLPCVPSYLGRPVDTSEVIWREKFIFTPDNTINNYWEAEFVAS